MTSGTSSGGSFITPQYLVDEWAAWRSYPPAFLEQTVKVDDAGYGLTMYLPALTGPMSTAQQLAENAGVINSGPGAGYLSSNLTTQSGEVDISQQLFDRAGPLNFDRVVYTQLQVQMNSAISAYVIAQAIAGANTIGDAHTTASGAAIVQDLYSDVATAKANMETTDGTKLPATHVFFQPTLGEYLLSQVDASGRPLLVPAPERAYTPITPAADGGPPPGYTGTRILNTDVFLDGSIPSSGSNSQIIVANMAEVFTLVSEPALRA